MSAESVRPVLRGMARWLGAGVISGFVSGFVIGGLGGRLAMFVLRLTSDPSLHGVKTDDDFVIGRLSSDSGFLILFCAFAGAAGGIAYVLVRGLLPPRHRVWLAGLLTALVGGSVVVHPGGIDFKLLSPLWLAIAMFVILPGLYGAAVSAMAENLGARVSNRVIPWLAILALPGLPAILGVSTDLPLIGVGIILLILLGVASMTVPAVRSAASSPPAIWLGRLGLTAAGVWAGFLLVRDAAAIL